MVIMQTQALQKKLKLGHYFLECDQITMLYLSWITLSATTHLFLIFSFSISEFQSCLSLCQLP